MTEGAAERCHGGDFTSVALLTYLFSDVKLNSSLKYMMLYMSLMGRSKRIVNHCFYIKIFQQFLIFLRVGKISGMDQIVFSPTYADPA